MSMLGVGASPRERRRAQEFAELLDGSRAAEGHELEVLVACASRLTPAPLAPRAEFRSTLRDALVAEAAVREPAVRRHVRRAETSAAAPRRVVRRLVAVASACVLVVSGAGVATASSGAVPGDALYGVKRSLESVGLALARSDLSRGHELLQQADHRLTEAESLADDAGATLSESAGLVDQSLSDLQDATQAGIEALTASYEDTGSREPLLELARFTVNQRPRLDDLSARLTVRLRTKVTVLSAELLTVQTQVESLLDQDVADGGALGSGHEPGDGWAIGMPLDDKTLVTTSAPASPSTAGVTPSGSATPGETRGEGVAQSLPPASLLPSPIVSSPPTTSATTATEPTPSLSTSSPQVSLSFTDAPGLTESPGPTPSTPESVPSETATCVPEATPCAAEGPAAGQ